MDAGRAILESIDGRLVAAHLEGQAEFRRAFPLFFRVVGTEVCRRLEAQHPGIRAHVGEDYRREAILRLSLLLPPVDWVAFSFPGYDMWDVHVGVVAQLDRWPPACQAGVHFTEAHRAKLGPLLRGVDWHAAVGAAGEWQESPAVGEIQQRDLARPLDLTSLAREATWFADRAAAYYSVVWPLVAAGRRPA